jgi:hypothetical protein
VILTKDAAAALTQDLPAELLGPPLNVFRICLHPEGLASRTLNFDEWATYLLAQLRRSIVLTGDPDLEALLAELAGYPNVAEIVDLPAASWDDPPLLVPFRIAMNDKELSLFTTITTFGTPRDVTLDELVAVVPAHPVVPHVAVLSHLEDFTLFGQSSLVWTVDRDLIANLSLHAVPPVSVAESSRVRTTLSAPVSPARPNTSYASSKSSRRK